MKTNPENTFLVDNHYARRGGPDPEKHKRGEIFSGSRPLSHVDLQDWQKSLVRSWSRSTLAGIGGSGKKEVIRAPAVALSTTEHISISFALVAVR